MNINEQMQATGMTLSEVVDQRLAWDRMRMDPADIADIAGATFAYLMNGKAAHENPIFLAKHGQRVRLRIVNASTMTFYDIRIPGLPMTVVQADGQNIKPIEIDEFRIGVAETYDVVVTMPGDRACTLFVETMERSGYARGALAPREGMSAAPCREGRGIADHGPSRSSHAPTRQFDLHLTDNIAETAGTDTDQLFFVARGRF